MTTTGFTAMRSIFSNIDLNFVPRVLSFVDYIFRQVMSLLCFFGSLYWSYLSRTNKKAGFPFVGFAWTRAGHSGIAEQRLCQQRQQRLCRHLGWPSWYLSYMRIIQSTRYYTWSENIELFFKYYCQIFDASRRGKKVLNPSRHKNARHVPVPRWGGGRRACYVSPDLSCD